MTKVSVDIKEGAAKKASGSAKVAKAGSSKSEEVSEFGGGAKAKIMEALGTFYYRNVSVVDKEKLIAATKMAPKTMSNTIPKLRNDGFIHSPQPKMIALTEKGIAALGDRIKCSCTNEEVHEKIKADLKDKGVKLFEALLDGETHDKDKIARDLGYKDGKKTKTFINLAGSMKTAKIIDYPDKTSIALNKETCFPFM